VRARESEAGNDRDAAVVAHPTVGGVALQNAYEGVCDRLIFAGNDEILACGINLVVITMTNGSVSITHQHVNSDLSLYGAELNHAVFSICGAFVRGTENVPLQGGSLAG
jgi:hypothetical protein